MVPAFLGYLVLGLFPAAALTEPSVPHGGFDRWGLALLGLVGAPVWGALAEAVRGVRPEPSANEDRDASRRARIATWLAKGRMATVWGMVISYGGLIVAGLASLAIRSLMGLATRDSNEPIYQGMIPGLCLSIAAPFVPRLVGLAHHAWWALTDPTAVRGEVVACEGSILAVRLGSGETLEVDAKTASGHGAHAVSFPCPVWVSIGAQDERSRHPYRGASDRMRQVVLDTAMDRWFRWRSVAALSMELAVLPLIPALWISWALRGT